ncbi:MAG: UDP-N-acetylglucosamine 2-epimerase [Bacteroidetes bacterium GWA2_30_7]|nr:MAG: UDP-N-acetylglucosamine 2-epimerase [Bacteroidetes bacterium GWA2_30_7]
MLRILNIIGARPQIIKAAAISRAIKNNFANKIEDIIVHTGQHYDKNMSDIFIDEMNIPQPKYNLNIGSCSHGSQTAAMIKGIEEIILSEKPNAVLLYGDTNSTLAGAIAASKLHYPVIHVEAGLRSFNKKMPEEINRITCDHASTLLFTPTETGLFNLNNEGFNILAKAPYSIDNPGVFHCGDVMYDNSLYFSKISSTKYDISKMHNIKSNNFILATIHRDNNTDNPERFESIIRAIVDITESNKIDAIIPLHPRTSKILSQNLNLEIFRKLNNSKYIKIIPPASFLEMIELERNASIILTDSGGVQKEAYFFKKPCLILRSETEWVELVENGNAVICDADYHQIIDNYNIMSKKNNFSWSKIFGNGRAAEFICEKIIETI